MKRILAGAMCLLMAACTTTDVNLAGGSAPAKPPAGAKVLVVQPDIQLTELTASGLQEPKADWTATARTNLDGEVQKTLKGRSAQTRDLDPNSALTGRTGQLLRLHEAVGLSILVFNRGLLKLPSKSGPFDWTLGDGAQTLGQAYDADYALFVYGRGSYSSAGRKAMMLGMAALGISIPLGSQQIFASLIDLKTGQVVWFNLAVAGPNADMRSPEGAHDLTQSLLKDLPL